MKHRRRDIDTDSLPYLDNVIDGDLYQPLYRIKGSDCLFELEILLSEIRLHVLGPEGVWLQGPTLALRGMFVGTAVDAENARAMAEWIRTNVRKIEGLS